MDDGKTLLEAAVAELDAAVDWRQLQPEDVTQFVAISHRLQSALSEQAPDLPEESVAGSIATSALATVAA